MGWDGWVFLSGGEGRGEKRVKGSECVVEGMLRGVGCGGVVGRCPDKESKKALKLMCDLYALERIWKDIGTYRNEDYVAPNKAKVRHVDDICTKRAEVLDLPSQYVSLQSRFRLLCHCNT